MNVNYRTDFDGEVWTARAFIQYGRRHADKATEVWFRSSERLAPDGNFLLPLTLMPAMERGEELVISPDAPISQKLLGNLDQLQSVYEAFGPPFGHHLKRVNVQVPGQELDPSPASGGVACFFSGGVDSFYSVLKHRDELDALIFIRGFDTRLDESETMELQTAEIRRIADELGLRVVEVTTNVRSTFSDAWLHWELYHGAVMGAIAHLLEPSFRRIYIASSHPYELLYACGTHPLLDPLWSLEGIELNHDGSEARWEKLSHIAENEVVQRHLKICWRNYSGKGNCGKCYQCLRAMGVLKVMGLLDLFPTFPPYEANLLETTGTGLIDYIQVSYDYWKVVKDDPELAAIARANINASIAKLQAHLQD